MQWFLVEKKSKRIVSNAKEHSDILSELVRMGDGLPFNLRTKVLKGHMILSQTDYNKLFAEIHTS